MSYLVLARKWRPTSFEDVVGQGPITQTLQNAIKRDRVPHALLFVGGRGIGKTSCARIFAKALNCMAGDGPNPTPCNACRSCVSITEGNSVDVFEIDGASNNSVEQIREIRDSVRFSPTVSRQKVYIIDEVHMLSTGAFNALLKTLEEPPPYITFIFATTEPHKVLDTIISRCQRFDFRQIGVEDIVAALLRICEAEGVSAERGALEHVAREAQGGMRDSLSLLDQMISFCGTEITERDTRRVLGLTSRESLISLLKALVSRDAEGVLNLIHERLNSGDDLSRLVTELLSFLRDMMVLKVSAQAQRVLSVSEGDLALMREAAEQLSVPQLHRLFNSLMKDAQEIMTSPAPRLSLEMALLQLCHQGESAAIEDVLTHLVQLEERLGGPPPPLEPRVASPSPQVSELSGEGREGFKVAQGTSATPAPQSQPPQVSEASRATNATSERVKPNNLTPAVTPAVAPAADRPQQEVGSPRPQEPVSVADAPLGGDRDEPVELSVEHIGFPELPYDLRQQLPRGEGVETEHYEALERLYQRLAQIDPFFASEWRLHTRPLAWVSEQETLTLKMLIARPFQATLAAHQSDFERLLCESFEAQVLVYYEVIEEGDERLFALEGLADYSERKIARLALEEVRAVAQDELVSACMQTLDGRPFYVRPQRLSERGS